MTEKMPLKLDDILMKFSIFGSYYRNAIVLMFLAFLTNNMYCTNFVFTAEESTYRCKDERFINNTCGNIKDPSDVCSEWEYDDPHSFIAEFQLACQEWKRTLVGTMHSIGYMAGLLIVGPLSDKLGRKKLLVITGVLSGVLGVARSFTSCYWMFIALEFLEAAVGDFSSPCFMLTIEMVSHDKLLLFQMLCGFGFSFGYLTLPLAAWLFPYWRHLLRVIYTPALLFCLYYFLIDESPRWLLSRGDKGKAVAILNKMSKKSKVNLEKDVFENLYYEDGEEIEFTQVLVKTFTSRALLKRFFICLSWWTTSTFVNYGMQIASVSLAGNKYINFGLIMPVDLIGNVIIIYIMSYFRRKIPLICSFILAAVFCFAQPFVPASQPWLSIFVFMIGKVMSSAYFTITYIFTSELFPTYTRNSMHALCSSLGHIGSTVAPQMPLLAAYWHGLPSIIFGLTSLGAGLVTLWVPDTADDALPDTVRQAEALGSKDDDPFTLIPLPYEKKNTQL